MTLKIKNKLAQINIIDAFVLLWFIFVAYCWILSFFNLLRFDLVRVFTIPTFTFMTLIGVCKVVNNIGIYRTDRRNSSKITASNYTKIKNIIAVTIWVLFVLIQLALIIELPPTNWDSMTYHLPKVGLALQYESMILPSNITITRINSSPWSSEIANLAFFSLIGKDHLVEIPQLLAAMGIAILLVKYIKTGKYWISLVVLSVPIFVTQMVTTQNDLLLYFLALYTFMCLKNLLARPSALKIVLLIAGSALFISIKATSIPILIITFITLICHDVYHKKHWRNKIEKFDRKKGVNFALTFLVTSIIALIVALPSYFISKDYYNNYLYQPPDTAAKFAVGINTFSENIKHFGSIFFGPTSYSYNNTYNHDTGNLGYVFVISVLLSIVLAVFSPKGIKKIIKDPLFQASTIFLIVFMVIHYPDPWDLRMVMFPLVTIEFLLISNLASTAVLEKLILVILVLGSCFVCYGWCRYVYNTVNEQPYTAPLSITEYWGKSRPSLIGLYNDAKFIDNKPDKILVIGTEDTWVYPYFKSDMSNKIFFSQEYEDEEYDFVVVDIGVNNHKLQDKIELCNKVISADNMTVIFGRKNTKCVDGQK